MTEAIRILAAVWEGPFSWPGFSVENGLPPIPRTPGLYLQTFEYEDGYLIYAAGITRRPIPIRFKEHTRKYMNGDYNVLDPCAAEKGMRKEIWHGWGYAKAHRHEFENRRPEIQAAAKEQLRQFRIFIAAIGTEERVLERAEASIMNTLACQDHPYCSITDKGMMLAPRWDHEIPVILRSQSRSKLHGLPADLEI